MTVTRGITYARTLVVLLVVGLLVTGNSAFTSNSTPPAEVQGQSFSIAGNDPLSSSGVGGADILTIGGVPLILCEHLGLLCSDPGTGASDDISALSFGWDFVASGLPSWQFSVAQGSRGKAGTAVRKEADCSPAQPQADVFETALDGSNLQDLDGDGVACADNQGFGLNLTEGETSDNVESLERDPCRFVDLNCDGLPEGPILFALASGSPSLALLGATSADILITAGEFMPSIWASGVTDLGLAAGDAIDALCIKENGNGVFDSEDMVLLSLVPGSPTLTALSAGAADLLRPAPPRVFYPASVLGLEATDDVDALSCAAEISFHDVFLPLVTAGQ